MGGRVEVEVEVEVKADVEVDVDLEGSMAKTATPPPEGRPWLISRHHLNFSAYG